MHQWRAVNLAVVAAVKAVILVNATNIIIY
jgi:hypothetical protein